MGSNQPLETHPPDRIARSCRWSSCWEERGPQGGPSRGTDGHSPTPRLQEAVASPSVCGGQDAPVCSRIFKGGHVSPVRLSPSGCCRSRRR